MEMECSMSLIKASGYLLTERNLKISDPRKRTKNQDAGEERTKNQDAKNQRINAKEEKIKKERNTKSKFRNANQF